MKLLALIIVLFTQMSFADQTITVGVTKKTLQSSQGRFSARLFTEILAEFDYKLVVKTLPPIRLEKTARTQKLDGELIRMSSYGEEHKHLTRIDEPTFQFAIAVYANDKNIEINSWESLAPYSLSHRKGVKVVSNELQTRFKNKKLMTEADSAKLLRLVSIKRLDLFIGVEYITDETIKKNKLSKKIHKLKVLKEDSAHFYLKNKYGALPHQISQKLKEYKSSGKYRKIFKSMAVQN